MLSSLPSTKAGYSRARTLAISFPQNDRKRSQDASSAFAEQVRLELGQVQQADARVAAREWEEQQLVVEPEFSEYEDSGYLRQVLGGSRSWLTSTILHLVVILFLALWTFSSARSPVVSLEMGSDDFSALADLEDLNFDSVELQSTAESEPPPQVFDSELISVQPEMELMEFADTPIEFENPLAGEEDQLQQLTRQLNSRQVQLGDGDASFFGIETTGKSIVYIVDRSGSMQEGNRWADATSELLKSIESLNADQKFFVYLFSNACHPMPQMEGRNKLVSATAENKARFRKWISNQVPDETTMPLSSVRRALNMRPDTIFLLTDGQFYDNTGEFLIRLADLQAKRTKEKSQVINTIAFYCNFELEAMLQEIALAHNGTFRSVQ